MPSDTKWDLKVGSWDSCGEKAGVLQLLGEITFGDRSGSVGKMKHDRGPGFGFPEDRKPSKPDGHG